MFKISMISWFIIQSYSVDDKDHKYLFYRPYDNVYINYVAKSPIMLYDEPYQENTWIKLDVDAECGEVKTKAPNVRHMELYRVSYICNAIKAEELKCTESNGAFINGKIVC